jgi:hypothetical protein
LVELIVGDEEHLVLYVEFDLVNSSVGQTVNFVLNLATVLNSSVGRFKLQLLEIRLEWFVENTLLIEEVQLREDLVNNDVNISVLLLDFNDLVKEDWLFSEVRTFEILVFDIKASNLKDFEHVLSNVGVHENVFISSAFAFEFTVIDQIEVTRVLLIY